MIFQIGHDVPPGLIRKRCCYTDNKHTCNKQQVV